VEHCDTEDGARDCPEQRAAREARPELVGRDISPAGLAEGEAEGIVGTALDPTTDPLRDREDRSADGGIERRPRPTRCVPRSDGFEAVPESAPRRHDHRGEPRRDHPRPGTREHQRGVHDRTPASAANTRGSS
jgi:hypothetical protein